MTVFFPGPTLVVSRESDVSRRVWFVGAAERAGMVGWEFFAAIDGPQLGLSTSVASKSGRHNRQEPEPLCAGEIGCLLSHWAIWSLASACEWPTVTVIEDDVEFCEDFASRWVDFLAALPKDWILIHGAQDHIEEPAYVNEQVSRVRNSYGTHFMLLRADAVDLLTDAPPDMTVPADWLLKPLFDTGRVYCPRTPLVRHLDSPGGMP